MAEVLDYATRPASRGAPWWLWVLATGSVLAASFWCFVPVKVGGRGTVAYMAGARGDVASLLLALDAFKQDVGRYPTQAEGFGALQDRPDRVETWNGPYVKPRAVPSDPWGTPYAYTLPPGAAPVVKSAGPDRTHGTADDIGSP
jgi:type II secretion system protein G